MEQWPVLDGSTHTVYSAKYLGMTGLHYCGDVTDHRSSAENHDVKAKTRVRRNQDYLIKNQK